jgi:uncharacterized protein (TIGR00369 family)
MQPDMLPFGQGVLASQPFSVLLGAELTAFAPGLATLELTNRPEFTQQFGLVHGGVLSYLADNALTFAGGTVLGASVLTAEYKINYVRAARGERLIARATVIAAATRQAVCRCDVFAVAAGVETLCATAQGTIVKTGE